MHRARGDSFGEEGDLTMTDPFTWWARRLPLPPRRTRKISPGVTESSIPGLSQSAESDMPWVVYTYGRIHDGWWPLWRSSRILGRAAVGCECAVCGKRRVIVVKLPRFGEVPVPAGGKHPERVRFLLDHIHKDRPHQMAWARPLLNMNASGPLDLDMLAMRLEADLARAETGEQP